MINLDFSKARVVVAGDVMLDRYWHGDVTRISPEAPVPVVRVREVRETPGGAANVAHNVARLGARCTLLSVVGEDRDGHVLEDLLRDSGVQSVFLRDPSLPTTVKLRILGRLQQIVRADFEGRPDHEMLLPLVERFETCAAQADAVIFSDYGKGGLSHLRQMMKLSSAAGLKILIDPKGSDYSEYHGATTLTPNREEFAQVAGVWSDESDFELRGFSLRDRLHLGSLLVTRSEEGMSLFLGSRHIRILTRAREVFDVSGAGDTVIATMATAMAAGMDIESAARLANIAAGIVVGKAGTIPIELDELVAHG